MWKKHFLFISWPSLDSWDLPNWDRSRDLIGNILRLEVEEEGYFKVFRDFKVPPLGKMLSEEALVNVGLSPIILEGE